MAALACAAALVAIVVFAVPSTAVSWLLCLTATAVPIAAAAWAMRQARRIENADAEAPVDAVPIG